MKSLNIRSAAVSLSSVLAIAAGGVATIAITSSEMLSLLTQATIYAMFALGLGLLLKQNGMVSFGHAAYFGSSGYLLGLFLQHHVARPELAILLAILAVGIFALILGAVIVRVPGIAFGMLTLAVGQMFFVLASRTRSVTGGADGLNIDFPNMMFGLPIARFQAPGSMFFICWTLLILLIAVLTILLGTRFGALTDAIRENPERARFIGIRTLLPRAAIYALSAMVTALAGILSAVYTGFVSPELLHWTVSGTALMMVVIGGFRTLWGPPLGAIVYFLARNYLGDVAQHWMAIFGIALIVVIVFWPTGIAGCLQRMVVCRKGHKTLTVKRGEAS